MLSFISLISPTVKCQKEIPVIYTIRFKEKIRKLTKLTKHTDHLKIMIRSKELQEQEHQRLKTITHWEVLVSTEP